MPAGQITVQLPSPPRALAAILEAAGDPNSDVKVLGKLVGSDPVFAAELLKVVNSPLYRPRSPVRTPQHAIRVLGLRGLRNLALCTATKSCVSAKKLGAFDLPRFWEDSLRRAVAARQLAPHYQVDPMGAFTTGLLQDLGVLVLMLTEPEQAQRWMQEVGASPNARAKQERDWFGFCHGDFAQRLAEAWCLPEDMAQVMRFHHAPEKADEPYRGHCRLAHNAELLAAVTGADDPRQALTDLREALMADLDFTDAEVEGLIDEVATEVTEAASSLGMRVKSQPTLAEILEKANQSLVEMNMSYEDLVRRLEQTLLEKEALQKELEERNRELEQLSITDTLTSLPNRRAFTGRLTYELQRSARSAVPCGLIIGDIDKFKSVNDTWGHDFGDQALMVVAEVLRYCVRKTDLVARVGGEEFAVILPDTQLEGAERVATKIGDAIRGKQIVTPQGTQYRPTISLGIAFVDGACREPKIAATINALYKCADGQLYEAKHAGRDRFCSERTPLDWIR